MINNNIENMKDDIKDIKHMKEAIDSLNDKITESFRNNSKPNKRRKFDSLNNPYQTYYSRPTNKDVKYYIGDDKNKDTTNDHRPVGLTSITYDTFYSKMTSDISMDAKNVKCIIEDLIIIIVHHMLAKMRLPKVFWDHFTTAEKKRSMEYLYDLTKNKIINIHLCQNDWLANDRLKYR
ncbi:unnamed protein product [Cunninghamella echinulata]